MVRMHVLTRRQEKRRCDVNHIPLRLITLFSSFTCTYLTLLVQPDNVPHPIDPEVVDKLIREDFKLGLPKYTIYVLNLPSLRVGGSSNYTYVPAGEVPEETRIRTNKKKHTLNTRQQMRHVSG